MASFFKKRDQSIGLAPGSLVFIGEKKADEMTVRIIDYDESTLNEDTLRDIKSAAHFIKTNTVSWINVDGLHDTDKMRTLGETFGLHPLLLEDVLNTGQRPKFEELDNVLFIVVKMLRYDRESQNILAEQLSMVVGSTFLLTFQERRGDVFEPVRERIRKGKGRVRAFAPDYLAYALLDTVVDNYIHIIEKIGEQIEELEEDVLNNPDASVIVRLNGLRREMGFLRKSVRPAREAILQLSKLDSDLIHPATAPFLKDLHDLSTQAAEAIDTYRDMLSDQLNIYNSTISNRMNEIMKVLTIFAAIFIPLTFIAGIYGTNFDYVPELKYQYSYFIFWGVMIAMAIGMLIFFKRRRWF